MSVPPADSHNVIHSFSGIKMFACHVVCRADVLHVNLQIAGVWHTAIVLRGYEYFFGGGVQKCPAGSTPYGRPVEVVDLGYAYGAL